MFKRAREEFVPYQEFLRRTRPRISRDAVTVHRDSGVYKRRRSGIRPRTVLRTGGLLPYPSNIERKFLDTAIVDDVSTTASITALNAMNSGTTASNRIGRRILMKSLQVRALIEREDPASTTAEHMRMMVVYDRQANGALPAITDILVTASVEALRNMANVGRFFVLFDEFIDVSTAAGGRSQQSFNKFVKFNLPVFYNAGIAGTVADIATGSLLMVYVGNRAAGVDDINVSMNCRLRFTDM